MNQMTQKMKNIQEDERQFKLFESKWNDMTKQDTTFFKHNLLGDWLSNGTMAQELLKFSKKPFYNRKCRKLEFNFAQHIATTFLGIKLKQNGQWTTLFGESLVKYTYDSKHNQVNTKPPRNTYKFNNKSLQPDWMTTNGENTYFKEVKTRTYSVSGTAGEKITHVPIKYSSLLSEHNKMDVVCVGFQEHEAKEMHILPTKDENNEGAPQIPAFIKDQVELWGKYNVRFVGLSTLYNS